MTDNHPLTNDTDTFRTSVFILVNIIMMLKGHVYAMTEYSNDSSFVLVEFGNNRSNAVSGAVVVLYLK